MTSLPRALTDIGTNNEISLLRAEPQSVRLYATVHNPATVYTARLAAVPTSTDQVTSITYDTGSGTHTNIVADQTMWVGTTSGAYDLGMVRIRNLTGIGATSGTFEIGEESEIAWSSGAYLTVKDEFSIWPKHIRLIGTEPYLDYDLAYTDQNSLCDSVPVMGQHRIGWLVDATVTLAFDAGDSWALNNSITGYVWVFPGASATTDLSTATPTATYNATGVYRCACTVTNDDGKSFTGYRYIFILQDETQLGSLLPTAQALQDMRLDSISGDTSSGGWSAQVTLYANADISLIRDRALCIIHTRDTYGTYNGSAGFLAGSENVLMIGWIAGETITRAADDQYSTVTFTIEGPHYWLNRIPAFPVGLKDRTTTPTKWTRFLGLSLKATVWHFLHWRTTITRCCDVFNTTNGYRAARIEAPGAQTLWEQLKSIEWTTVLAQPCADRYGRMFNQIEQQLLDTADRAAVPECMTLDDQDISGAVEIERNIIDNSSIVDLSGMSYDGSTGTPYFSLSPGRVFRRYGSAPEVVDQLVLYDQATSNTLCGWYAGWKNNEYPRLSMTLGSGNRFVDIAPYQYWLYTLAAADSPRGIAKSFRLIPRRVSYQWANTGGYLLTQVEFEAENVAELAITGDTPASIPVTPPITPPIVPPVDPIPTPSGDAREVWYFTTEGIYWSGDVQTGGQLAWNKVAGSLPGTGAPTAGFATANGTSIYLIYPQNANAGIWQCSNPKDPTPTWTDILAGEYWPSTFDYYLRLKDGNADWGMQLNTLWAVGRGYTEPGGVVEDLFYGFHFGSYNGASWTWTIDNWDSGDSRWAYSWFNAKNYYLSCPGATVLNICWSIPDETPYSCTAIGYLNQGFSNTTPSTIWSFSPTSAVMLFQYIADPTRIYLWLPYTDTLLTELTDFVELANQSLGSVCGSLTGNKIFAINTGATGAHQGDIWIGDTTGVAYKANWQYAVRVHDAAYAGGGALWVTLSQVTQNNEVIRVSNDNGTTWLNMTGDFWSVAPASNLTFIGSGMVY